MPTIRPSRDEDLPAITAIYAHHVLHGTGTFETDPPSAADMAARRADVLGRGLPYLVAEERGEILGFAYANWFKPRPAYRFSAEDSIYVADTARGRGVGRLLLDALCEAAEAAGVRKLLAVIGDAAFRIPGQRAVPLWAALLAVMAIIGLSVAVLEKRIRGVEVVK